MLPFYYMKCLTLTFAWKSEIYSSTAATPAKISADSATTCGVTTSHTGRSQHSRLESVEASAATHAGEGVSHTPGGGEEGR